MKTVKAYLVLCRVIISLFAACSAFTGYILTPDRDLSTVTLLIAGVFLLSSGSSALNQYQERDIDALMERTRLRPLPAGTLAPRTALRFSIGLLFIGLIMLGRIDSAVPALGAFAVLWYNGLYTPLKRRTAFAAVPGAVVGAIPPVMGWTAGGMSVTDPKIFAVAALFFLWQIPHFWLLLIGDGGAYERAGLPALSRILPKERLAPIVVLWTAAASVACLALPLYGVATSRVVHGLFLILALSMTLTSLTVLRKVTDAAAVRSLFRKSTLFLMIVMVLLSLDSVLRRC